MMDKRKFIGHKDMILLRNELHRSAEIPSGAVINDSAHFEIEDECPLVCLSWKIDKGVRTCQCPMGFRRRQLMTINGLVDL